MQQIVRKAIATVRELRRVAGNDWPIDLQDVVLLLGLALLSIGLAQVYAPMLLITPGAAFTYLAWPKRSVIAVKAKSQES